MNWSVGKKIAAGFGLSLLILGGFLFITNQNEARLISTNQWVAHTHEVLRRVQDVYASLSDAESAARGFLISGDAAFLNPYNSALSAVSGGIRNLKDLTADNPKQQRRLSELESLIAAKLGTVSDYVDRGRATRLDAAQSSIAAANGKKEMDDIRRVLSEMVDDEETLLKQRQAESTASVNTASARLRYGTMLALILVLGTGYFITRGITRPINLLKAGADKIGSGETGHRVAVQTRDEVGQLAQAFNKMAESLEKTQAILIEQDWLKGNVARLTQSLQGKRDPAAVAQLILSELAPLMNSQHSVFYVKDTGSAEGAVALLASYGYTERKNLSNRFKPGEGLVGQCIIEKTPILLTEAPADYIRISSGLGSAAPLNIIVMPVMFEGDVLGVIEMGSLAAFTASQRSLLDQMSESIGIVVQTIFANARTEALLRQSQSLTEELKVQQEELTESNRRLEEQTQALKSSEALLKEQQAELQQNNEELAEKAELLAGQNAKTERQNREIEIARTALEEKAAQLALTSKYKSEFLANMSHELRTPLNSILILSKLLSGNEEGNLRLKQVDYAKTIYSSGADLLNLINDILDLSKIESGVMSVEIGEVTFSEVEDYVQKRFQPIAAEKHLGFNVDLVAGLLPGIQTDGQRLQQVLNNLLSNAFKFSERGQVDLKIETAASGWSRDNDSLNRAGKVIGFSVRDTGIGIPADKHETIFKAFQQVDGTTSRRFGGTGLGLSISREIARLLGGELMVKSEPDEGSTFTLYLPEVFASLSQGEAHSEVRAVTPQSEGSLREKAATAITAAVQTADSSAAFDPETHRQTRVTDDRYDIKPGDRVLLVIEDDVNFARILVDLARARGFKTIAALDGESGLALAKQFKPDAITLDLRLPSIDGWTVLDRLKHDRITRPIPVHIISVEEGRKRGLSLGAISYLTKPVSQESLNRVFGEIESFAARPAKNLLVVEDDDAQRGSIIDLIGNGDVHTTAVATGEEALNKLKSTAFDCIVLDLGLPDMSGFELIGQMKDDQRLRDIPIIIYTGKELTERENSELRGVSEAIIVKGVRSPERLLDETALFLHRVEANLPEHKRRMLDLAQQPDRVLAGRKVLIVDDDVRNIFALTSILERHQMQVVYAENGRDGIKFLKMTPGIEIVLLDVMMPEMDGYEATREIRQDAAFARLPIIAVTAKAMKGDRDKCISAGASDYITKPIDVDQLLSLLRVWLYR
ncbi:MAG: two-component system sensor histidine kinase/response regulator [Blastocatellia bacterium AA13]|nr:MAG: two-component system sensor histidine kinase/response regulator [Blastocatellia bacterium AA13]